MPNNLGLDDEWDGVELIKNLEKAFEVRIADAEAERVATVGELYDLLLTKIPPNEADRKCATAMTYYRLKRAIQTLGLDLELSPSTDLTAWKPRGVKAIFRQLEQLTGLRLPLLPISYAGSAMLALSFCAMLGFYVFYHRDLSPVSSLIPIAGLVVVWWTIIGFDRRRLPQGCSTFGALSRKVAALNYGRLIQVGANRSDSEIWKHFLELLSEYALPKSEITRATYFLRSQLKKNASTA